MHRAAPAWLLILLTACFPVTGCNSVYSRPVDQEEFVAYMRVESFAMGGGVKVNGMLASHLPGVLRIPVDRNGIVERVFVITLSTNVIQPERATVTLGPGDTVPARVYFAADAPTLYGTALPNRVQ